MNINILGNDYRIIVLDEPNKYMVGKDLTAYCDMNQSTITLVRKTDDNNKKSARFLLRDLAHELAHIYLFEQGRSDLDDEEIAEHIAVMVTDILYHKKWKDIDKIIKEVRSNGSV